MTYQPVQPTEHDEACARKIPATLGSGHKALDPDCARCRGLIARLDEAHARRAV